MEATGKLSDAKRLALYLNNVLLPVELPQVSTGLRALFDIHKNANELVEHNGAKLNNVLKDKDILRTYVLAATVELSEFLQTFSWKPWRDVEAKPSRETVTEFADVIAFIGVLLTILQAYGIAPETIATAYIEKERENIQRFIQKLEAAEAVDPFKEDKHGND